MAFCSNCGKEVDINEAFCPECGTRMEEVADNTYYQPETETVPEAPNYKKFIIPGVVVVAVIAVVVVLFSLFGSSPEKVVKKALNAMQDGNAKKIVSLIPDKAVDATVEEEFDGDKDEFYDQLEEGFGYMEDELDDAKWEIKSVKDVDDDELEDIQDEWDEEFDVKVKDAKKVKVKLKKDGESETVEIPVIKVGGSWYLNVLDF